MKKVLVLAGVFFSLALVSCKKDNEANEPLAPVTEAAAPASVVSVDKANGKGTEASGEKSVNGTPVVNNDDASEESPVEGGKGKGDNGKKVTI